MRKLIFLAIVFAAVMTTSCNKDEIEAKDEIVDFTNPVNLSGTTWKFTANDQWLEYSLLIFPSSTTVEGWDKKPGNELAMNWTGTFTIEDKTILMNMAGGSVFTGIIVGETITSTYDETIIFLKQ